MDALEFLKEKKRMCRTFGRSCDGCPCGKAECGISSNVSDDGYERVIAIVEQWSKEHPRKTRQSVLLEQWPEAKLTKDGVISICPITVSAAYRDETGDCAVADRQCADCRNRLKDRLAAYEDKVKTPEEVLPKDKADEITLKLMRLADLESLCGYTRLRELAEADKDGRLVVLPCKVGDTGWVTRNPWTGKLLKKPLDAYVNGMKMYSHGLYVNLLFDTRKINGARDYEINHIGKTVFLTHEQAVKALEAMKDG